MKTMPFRGGILLGHRQRVAGHARSRSCPFAISSPRIVTAPAGSCRGRAARLAAASSANRKRAGPCRRSSIRRAAVLRPTAGGSWARRTFQSRVAHPGCSVLQRPSLDRLCHPAARAREGPCPSRLIGRTLLLNVFLAAILWFVYFSPFTRPSGTGAACPSMSIRRPMSSLRGYSSGRFSPRGEFDCLSSLPVGDLIESMASRTRSASIPPAQRKPHAPYRAALGFVGHVCRAARDRGEFLYRQKDGPGGVDHLFHGGAGDRIAGEPLGEKGDPLEGIWRLPALSRRCDRSLRGGLRPTCNPCAGSDRSGWIRLSGGWLQPGPCISLPSTPAGPICFHTGLRIPPRSRTAPSSAFPGSERRAPSSAHRRAGSRRCAGREKPSRPA